MHDEALEALPAVLETLGLECPFLLGHSDGGSIALINAGGTHRPLSGIMVMAPHVLVEDFTLAGIRKAVELHETTDLPARLARHHRDAATTFRVWQDIWLDPAFRSWNIENYLATIRCPVLALQGEDDEYGTMEQIERIARQVADVDLVKLADCRHSPHKDQPEAVIEAVSGFVARILDAQDIAA
jgi:pimeloyl-ACP methyl ester carboxylesterase